LETRRLHALTREKAVDRFAMDAQDAADTHRIESTVVDQPPDRLRMHAELIRHLANTDEPGISA
jgi:phage gp46-like protein